MQNFVVIRLLRKRKRIQEPQYLFTVLKIPTRHFADHKGMAQHLLIVKQRDQALVPSPEMIDPYRRINKDHFATPERRLRTGRNCFSLPPSSARRRALSRAINASSPK